MLFLEILYKLEKFSNNTLTSIFVNTEMPLGNFLNSIFKLDILLPILLATFISSIVAVKLNKTFEGKKKIFYKKLAKESIKELLLISLFVFIWTILFLICLSFLYALVKKGMEYTSLGTLGLLIEFFVLYLQYKKYHKKKKLANLKRIK